MMDEFFIGTILDTLGAGIRYLFSKIFGNKNRFIDYLNDEYSSVNVLIGTIAFLSVVLIVLFLVFKN